MKPYKIIEDNAERIVYEYKPSYVWALYVIVGIAVPGLFLKEEKMMIPGLLLLVLYMIFISSQYYQVGKKTKAAMKKGAVQMTGSKWSFKNPLRVSIPKQEMT